MPRPAPLPDDLPTDFAVQAAMARGLSRERLRRSDLRTPFPGVRSAGVERDTEDPLLRACREYAPRLRDGQFYSHETALALHGVPMPEWPYRPRLHVSTHRPRREPRVAGVVGHRLQRRESLAVPGAHGFAVETPVRAWRQSGGLWRLDDLIVAADALVAGEQPLATADDLRSEIEIMGDVRDGILKRALAEVRIGVRSPRETRLRLLLVRAGLPEPSINWILRDADGGFVAELDLAYPRWKVAPEYDGRVHADDPEQFAKDGDRWDRIRRQGWDHIRIMKHHMRGTGAVAAHKVRDALVRAGWRPRR